MELFGHNEQFCQIESNRQPESCQKLVDGQQKRLVKVKLTNSQGTFNQILGDGWIFFNPVLISENPKSFLHQVLCCSVQFLSHRRCTLCSHSSPGKEQFEKPVKTNQNIANTFKSMMTVRKFLTPTVDVYTGRQEGQITVNTPISIAHILDCINLENFLAPRAMSHCEWECPLSILQYDPPNFLSYVTLYKLSHTRSNLGLNDSRFHHSPSSLRTQNTTQCVLQ